MSGGSAVSVVVTIDTEEDQWSSYDSGGKTVENVPALAAVQEVFDRTGARPTYLVNYAPLEDARSVELLGSFAERPDIEIGAHLHPWCTPPFTDVDEPSLFMCDAPAEQNSAKLGSVVEAIERELGITPRSFRAGRWGVGPSVTSVFRDHGLDTDCSVSPLVDWGVYGGPDFSDAPLNPYRFHPTEPTEPTRHGSLIEVPPTVGFFGGNDRARNRWRRRLESMSAARRLKMIGILDRAGLLTRRWLSPEQTTVSDMIRLADDAVAGGRRLLQATFHSGVALPGATPFVSSDDDKHRFLHGLGAVLDHFVNCGYRFCTLSEAAAQIGESGPAGE